MVLSRFLVTTVSMLPLVAYGQGQVVLDDPWTSDTGEHYADSSTLLKPLRPEDLQAQLSANATVLSPGQEGYDDLTLRWQNHGGPTFKWAVAAAIEDDVINTVKYARQHELQFLPYTGGHGAPDTLSTIRDAVGISLRKLNYITVNPDGKTATIGGGAKTYEVTKALWQDGKQTSTGVCECTGFISPMLGGGHGYLQGQYGLSADQLVSARVVLANGTLVTASEDTNPDLLWALKGAGQNFGVVTEAVVKVYDVPFNTGKEKWTIEQFILKGDKVEDVFEIANGLLDIQPPEFTHFVHLISMPAVDPQQPIILLTTLLNGLPEQSQVLSKPIRALGPITSTIKQIDYPDTPAALLASNNDAVCVMHGNNASILTFPVDLYSYNISAMRSMYNVFAKGIRDEPKLNGSAMMVEGFSVQGVKAIPEKSTAIPFRGSRMLLSPTIMYQESENSDGKLGDAAFKLGQAIRSTLQAGSGMNHTIAYVNYARGDEGPEAWYGYENWRQDKLKALKRAYDPDNMFGGYAPIPRD